MALEIMSTTSDLNEYGGAQKVLLDLHNGIKSKYNCKILGFTSFEQLHPKYRIEKSEYVKFTNPFLLNNKVLIVHARNIMALIMVIKWIFFLNTRIIYVAHNVYSTHRWFSFFPNDIVSISNRVTENLLGYFNLKKRKTTLIYNGIIDEGAHQVVPSFKKNRTIKILYSARVIDVKRQLMIVDCLKGKLHEDIEILFAGKGPDYSKLVEKCNNTTNFKALGFVEHVNDLVKEVDFLMLFSTQEGLPISLIEGIMYGKPLLVNDVGGNLEIGIPGINCIELTDSWTTLAGQINSIVNLSQLDYQQMSKNSRQHYEKMFTYDVMIENYTRLINSL